VKLNSKIGLTMSGLVLLIFSVSANPIAPINITVCNGVLAVDAPKGDNGVSNFGDGTVFTWLSKYDVTKYDGLKSASLPAPTSAGDSIAPNKWTEDSAGDATINLTGKFDYIFLHWGGSGGGVFQAYCIEGLTGEYTFDNPTGKGPGTLSFDNLYAGIPSTTLPDGGTTALLLGLAVAGLGLIRSKNCVAHLFPVKPRTAS
jgi:VPDSG-CTERM motif